MRTRLHVQLGLLRRSHFRKGFFERPNHRSLQTSADKAERIGLGSRFIGDRESERDPVFEVAGAGQEE